MKYEVEAGDANKTNKLSMIEIIGFALSMFVVGSFFLALSPILQDVASDLDADPNSLGYPGGAYGLALGIVAVSLAPLHDMVQRRTMILTGMVLHFTGLVAVALAPSWGMLVFGHALCGCGGGIIMPAAYATISDRTPDFTRAHIIGRVNVGWAASTLVGVPAFAVLGDIFGWRQMMLVLAVFWVFIAILISRILLANDQRDRTNIKVADFWTRKIFSSMQQASLLWLFASTIMIFIGFYGVYTYLGLAIRSDLDINASGAGIFVAIYGLGFLIGTLNSKVIDRIGAERSLCLTTALLALLLVAIPQLTHSTVLLSMGVFLWGIFQNGAFTSFTTAVIKVNESIRGRALSINTACVFLGASIGTALMGVVNSSLGFSAVGVGCMIVTATAAAIVGWKLVLPLSGNNSKLSDVDE